MGQLRLECEWLIVGVLRSGQMEFIAMDRKGREGGSTAGHPFADFGSGSARVAADALWTWRGGSVSGGDPRAPLIRIPFDARTGRFSGHMDTVYTGRITAFDVTRDGGTVILDEGSADFSVWAMDLADAFHGALPTTTDCCMRLRRSTQGSLGLGCFARAPEQRGQCAGPAFTLRPAPRH